MNIAMGGACRLSKLMLLRSDRTMELRYWILWKYVTI